MSDISPSAPIKFGSFEAVCEHAALLVCPLLHTPHGVEPDCYGRNVQLGSQLIFQPGECFRAMWYRNVWERSGRQSCSHRRTTWPWYANTAAGNQRSSNILLRSVIQMAQDHRPEDVNSLPFRSLLTGSAGIQACSTSLTDSFPPLGTCFIHIGALGMTIIMIYHVRSKYTAVGKCCCKRRRRIAA